MNRSWLFLLPVLAGSAAAQGVPLVLEGDAIAGFGTVTDVQEIAVDAGGGWAARVILDGHLSAVLHNGAVVLRDGDALSSGATVQGIWSLDLGAGGEVSALVGTQGAEALAVGATAVVTTGDAVTAPGAPAGALYADFTAARINAERTVALLATIDDPAPGTDLAIVRLELDAAGAVVSAATVVQDGDELDGVAGAVSLAGSKGYALNDAGDVIYHARTIGNDVELIARNQAAVAVEGEPSAIFGATWHAFGRAALNDAGDTVFAGWFGASVPTGAMLCWNGIKLVQSGDELPAIAPYALWAGGSMSLADPAPLHITDDARVVWLGEWVAPDPDRDSGIFVDHELVLQEGVSLVGGVPLDEIDLFDVSDDGRFLALTAVRADGTKGAFLLDLEPSATPYSGCAAPAAELTLLNEPALGSFVAFQMHPGQAFGVLGFVGISSAPAAGFPPCGIPLGGAGELLIDVAAPNPFAVLGPAPWPTFGVPGFPASITVLVPDHVTLLGATVYAQGLFVDPSGLAPGEPLRLTNGLRIVVGDGR